MAGKYYRISTAEMIAFLEQRTFQRIQVPNTKEIVFGKRYDYVGRNEDTGEITYSIPMTVRVYTSCSLNGARDVGEDAIRVCVLMEKQVALFNGKGPVRYETKIVPVGAAKRVHRISTWEKNLAQRLDDWQDLLKPLCPECSAPMNLRVPRQGEKWHAFYGCCRYPTCKCTRTEHEGNILSGR